MSGKHTKGPWFVGELITNDGQIGINDGEERVCLVDPASDLPRRNRWKSECALRAANATLIAAAPDLLAALESAVACGMVPRSSAAEGGALRHSEQVRVADNIRAAIARAKGETQ